MAVKKIVLCLGAGAGNSRSAEDDRSDKTCAFGLG